MLNVYTPVNTIRPSRLMLLITKIKPCVFFFFPPTLLILSLGRARCEERGHEEEEEVA